MSHKIKKTYQLYILPLILSTFWYLNTTPVFAADITRQKVGQKGAAQYNQLMKALYTIFGLCLCATLILAIVVGIDIAYEASRRFTAGDSRGFYDKISGLGKLFLNAFFVSVIFSFIAGMVVLMNTAFTVPKPQ